MAQENINLGTSPSGQDGDTVRTALQKAQDNFTELYSLVGPVFKNRLINGNFDFWQRGVSAAGFGYLADRFYNGGAGSTVEISRQAFAIGQTAVPNNPSFFQRTVVTSVAGTGNFASTTQAVEGVAQLSGEKVTLSFWAKADTARPMAVELMQYFGSGGSPSPTVNGIGATVVNLTAAWQFFSISATLPSVAGKAIGTNGDDYTGVNFWYDAGSNFDTRTGNLGQQSGTFDIAQVQVEEGTVATAFELRPQAVELSLCQRYYEKSFPIDTAPAANTGYIGAVSVTQVSAASAQQFGIGFTYKVTKRINPALTIYNPSAANNQVRNTVIGADCSGTGIGGESSVSGGVIYTTTPPGTGAGQPLDFHWAADAEL